MKETRAIILGLLAQQDLYGYQIKKQLQAPDLDWASIPVASLYHELSRLSEQQLIEQVATESAGGRPARAVYRITPLGRQALADELQEAWQSTDLRRTEQDVAAYFMNVLDDATLLVALDARLADLRDEVEQVTEKASAERTHPQARTTYLAIVDHLLARLQAEIEWTHDLMRRIESHEFRPAAPAKEPSPASSELTTRTKTQPGLGAFTFVLHSHIPYCRMAGRWPHGEEWIHEAIAETYVPLLIALYDLRDQGVPFRITIGLTPVLVEQLADLDIQTHFLQYLDEEIDAAKADIARFGEEEHPHLEYLAGYYDDSYTRIRTAYLERFGGDVVGAFRRLQDEGLCEIVTCGATHGYLPLLSRDSSIYAQIRTAIASYEHHFGRSPRAIWLPECAYRPAYVSDDGVTRPAIEEFLAPLGISCFFVETHAIEGGRPVGKASREDAPLGPYGGIARRYVIPAVEEKGPGGTTFKAYAVVGNLNGLTNPPVAAIGRNNRTGQQVWSASWGYPGDGDYREFHKKDHVTGLQYWRITGPNVDLAAKDLYHPDWAAHKVASHAEHYVRLIEDEIRAYADSTGNYGIIASNYDTELFGHWWFEGIEWIKRVLAGLAGSDIADLTTASDYLKAHPVEEQIALPESSWGAGGTHWTWDNPDTHWMWKPIHRTEARMERLLADIQQPSRELQAVLAQAARELLLLQSSDWPFLVTTGQAKQYAIERFGDHIERFDRLCDMAEAGSLSDTDREYLARVQALDNVFPNIESRWFAARQGRAH